MIKYSIVIPTYNHLNDCLIPCCESIIQNTTLSNCEVIIVGNGCVDETKDYILNLSKQYPFKYLDFDKPLGYPKAINEGLLSSSGEYVILLNNDIVLLDYGRDRWIKYLEEPFNKVKSCGITGPSLSWSDEARSNFIIFFCAMISREVINKVGLLDTTFNIGSGEDIDYCVSAKSLGFTLHQVPFNSFTTFDGAQVVGGFPIYHKGEQTVGELSNWKGIFEGNMNILRERYK